MATLERVLVAIGRNDRDHVDAFLNVVGSTAAPTGATVYFLYVFPREEHEELMARILEARIRGTIGEPETEVARVAEDIDADLSQATWYRRLQPFSPPMVDIVVDVRLVDVTDRAGRLVRQRR